MGNSASHHWPLPVELIAEIFNFSCEDYRRHVRNAMDEIPPKNVTHSEIIVIRHEKQEYSVSPVVTISQVCRAWKEIAYHTPVLWDTLFVDKRGCLSIKLKEWLDRSVNCPLTVKINLTSDLVYEPLLDCSSRWKRIDICCLGSHRKLYSEMENIMRQSPPLLESFICRPSFHCFGLEIDNIDHSILSVESVRNLTQLAMFKRPPLSFFPSRIKVCRWDGNDATIVINQLKDMSKSIRDCSIYDPWIMRMMPPLSTPLRLSLLENFSVRLWTVAYNYILPSLELPVLRRNARVLTRTATVDVLGNIYAFLLRSNSPHVQVLDLDISAAYFNGETLLNILRIVPTLECFRLVLQRFGRFSRKPFIEKRQQVPVILNSLTSYYIDMSHLDCDSDRNATMLKYLTLPASPTVSKFAYLAALNLVHRSNCPLKILKINTENNISSTGLLDLLKVVPSLECLHLVGQNYNRNSQVEIVEFQVTSSLFELLLPQPQTSPGMIYLPKLSELSCEGALCADWNEILSALEYRWKGDVDCGVQRLARVRVYAANSIPLMDEMSHQRLHNLQLQGMDVKFRESFHIMEGMVPVRY
ncbi:hypothetical protein BDQ17DRAFT_1375249 [Cyathus striatus]|nr:hypothetical protein BDQ17DRAFT_1375249 [Cyathus striatus]